MLDQILGAIGGFGGFAGLAGLPFIAAYGVAKAGIEMMTKVLAQELAPGGRSMVSSLMMGLAYGLGGAVAEVGRASVEREGADVTIVYRRERRDMPAIAEEVEAAEHEGAKLDWLEIDYETPESRAYDLEIYNTRFAIVLPLMPICAVPVP